MRPVAVVRTELRAAGAGYVALGLAGLVAALALGASAGRALVPFVVVTVLLAAVHHSTAGRWMRREAAVAPELPEGTRVEETRLTIRRTAVVLTLPALALVALLTLRVSLGAVYGGVMAGIGLVDLITERWAAARAAAGDEVLRELGPTPFAGGRRPLYTRPTSDRTRET